jgi:hypothetical protein
MLQTDGSTLGGGCSCQKPGPSAVAQTGTVAAGSSTTLNMAGPATSAMAAAPSVVARPGDVIIIVGPGGPCERRLVPCTVCQPGPDGRTYCHNVLCDVIVCEPPRPIII